MLRGDAATVDVPRPAMDLANRAGTDPGTVRQGMVDRIPLRRFASVEELADAHLLLCSPLARHMTGQSLLVDGGMQVG